MNEVGFNEEFTQLQLRYRTLKEENANQIELYTHLVNVVGPNLKCHYMVAIGQYEHRIYELKTEISRWQRRFTLRQTALNRGEKPDLVGIEAQSDAEFADYMKAIRRHIDEIKEAAARFHAEKMTDEECTAFRACYLDAVKKLHPDINPDLPESARDLWHQIQAAYAEHDWTAVKFLCGLVDGVVTGEAAFEASVDGVKALEKSIAALEAKCRELGERMAALKLRKPYVYEEFLRNPEAVSLRRTQLLDQIGELEGVVREYTELWKNGT